MLPHTKVLYTELYFIAMFYENCMENKATFYHIVLGKHTEATDVTFHNPTVLIKEFITRLPFQREMLRYHKFQRHQKRVNYERILGFGVRQIVLASNESCSMLWVENGFAISLREIFIGEIFSIKTNSNGNTAGNSDKIFVKVIFVYYKIEFSYVFQYYWIGYSALYSDKLR